MSMQRIGGLPASLVLAAVVVLGQKPTAEALFREALVKERAEGSLREAIFLYERIIVDFPNDRRIAAQAMYQLSLIYEKQGDPRAKRMLTRLSREYADVEPFATRAREGLAQQSAESPSVFPEVSLPLDYDRGSPDGRFVVYHKDASKSGVLYLKELATGLERVLVDGGYVMHPAWSPDSTRLAYGFSSLDQKIREIRIVQVSSGETVKLGIRGWPITWTDSDEIFFYLPNYGVDGADFFLVPVAGGTPRKVHTGEFSTAITPDGARLIARKSEKLFLIDLATGDSQAITTSAGSEYGFMISPDSRLVIFKANPEGHWAFYIAPLDEGLPVKSPLKVKVVEAEGGPAAGRPWRKWWTRDGTLTFPLGRSLANIYRVDVDPKSGRAVDTPLRLTQDTGYNNRPAISPDGKRVAYWYAHQGKFGLAVMDSGGANERPLLEQLLNVPPLYWRSPEEIMFLNTKPKEGNKRAVYTVNVNIGALERVAEAEGLYWHYVPGRNEILQVVGDYPKPATVLKALSLTDGKQRVVATVDALWPHMAISPDGKRIAYMASRGQIAAQLSSEMALMSINGEPLGTLVSAQQELITPNAWSPNGKYLLYTLGKAGPRVMNVETRESWPIHRETADGNWQGGNWSPDGTFILLVKATQTEERVAWSGVTAEAVARLMEER
ncbi:MAG: PD40 domain-containing protein [Acidobacteria bacterium]|nr:PD40 domain-containing protein [Acidobacteriota bacterium]